MVQRKRDDGKRPRISVSLDPEEYDWIKQLGGPSESYCVSRIVKAARLAGLSLDDATHSGGSVADFYSWLKKQKNKNKIAVELHELLSEYFSKQI